MKCYVVFSILFLDSITFSQTWIWIMLLSLRNASSTYHRLSSIFFWGLIGRSMEPYYKVCKEVNSFKCGTEQQDVSERLKKVSDKLYGNWPNLIYVGYQLIVCLVVSYCAARCFIERGSNGAAIVFLFEGKTISYFNNQMWLNSICSLEEVIDPMDEVEHNQTWVFYIDCFVVQNANEAGLVSISNEVFLIWLRLFLSKMSSNSVGWKVWSLDCYEEKGRLNVNTQLLERFCFELSRLKVNSVEWNVLSRLAVDLSIVWIWKLDYLSESYSLESINWFRVDYIVTIDRQDQDVWDQNSSQLASKSTRIK